MSRRPNHGDAGDGRWPHDRECSSGTKIGDGASRRVGALAGDCEIPLKHHIHAVRAALQRERREVSGEPLGRVHSDRRCRAGECRGNGSFSLAGNFCFDVGFLSK